MEMKMDDIHAKEQHVLMISHTTAEIMFSGSNCIALDILNSEELIFDLRKNWQKPRTVWYV